MTLQASWNVDTQQNMLTLLYKLNWNVTLKHPQSLPILFYLRVLSFWANNSCISAKKDMSLDYQPAPPEVQHCPIWVVQRLEEKVRDPKRLRLLRPLKYDQYDNKTYIWGFKCLIYMCGSLTRRRDKMRRREETGRKRRKNAMSVSGWRRLCWYCGQQQKA